MHKKVEGHSGPGHYISKSLRHVAKLTVGGIWWGAEVPRAVWFQ